MDAKTKVRPEGPESGSIVDQFRPLTKVLTIFGPYRMKLHDFTEVRATKESVTGASATWRYLRGLYPYLLLLWYILASLIWACNVELDLPFPFRL